MLASRHLNNCTQEQWTWFKNQPSHFHQRYYERKSFAIRHLRCYSCEISMDPYFVLNDGRFICTECMKIIQVIKYQEQSELENIKYNITLNKCRGHNAKVRSDNSILSNTHNDYRASEILRLQEESIEKYPNHGSDS